MNLWVLFSRSCLIVFNSLEGFDFTFFKEMANGFFIIVTVADLEFGSDVLFLLKFQSCDFFLGYW